jgi:hypothetical protein
MILCPICRSERNTADLSKLEAKVSEAREKFGEVEVFEAQRDRAEYFSRIGDKAGALAAYDEINQKGLSTGQKIDIVMAKVRRAGGATRVTHRALVGCRRGRACCSCWTRRCPLPPRDAPPFAMMRTQCAHRRALRWCTRTGRWRGSAWRRPSR